MTRKWTLSTTQPFMGSSPGVDFSNPVLSEDTLIFGNRTEGLTALYPSINQKRWSLPLHGGVVSPLSLHRGSVYFGAADGFIYSVNAETGKINWRYEVRNPVVSKPTISGGRVFVTTSDDVVYALDAGTGKWLWHYRRQRSGLPSIYGASAPLVDGNEVLSGFSDGFLVALSLEEGQLKWERRLHSSNKFTDVNAQPVLENGIIYLPSYDGALYAIKRNGGATLWRFDAGGSKDVVIEGERLYLPSSDGFIYSLSKENSQVFWKFQLDGGTPTQLAITDEYVIVGSSYQYLYVLDKKTGSGLYRMNLGYGSGFYGSPLFDRESQKLFFLSSAGNLYCFSLKHLHSNKKLLNAGVDPYSFRSF
ncbi:MAG: PQQ-binding-like beta-propeller repeat protein [Bdellovibrionia bacterium]